MEIENIYMETYGCSANQNNSEIISGLLQQAGLNVVKNKKIAGLAILNTCIVKGPTEQRMISRIRELGRKFGKRLVVTGCMPDVESSLIKNILPQASLIGSHHIHEICNAIKKISVGKRFEIVDMAKEVKLCMPKLNQNKVIGITQILEGCVGSCSFCVTRLAKGRLFSYPSEKVLENVKRDLAGGCREIWITSQDNAAYGLDGGNYELPEFLQKMLDLKSRFLVRLGMMNPNHVLPVIDELINCYKNKKMFKFLHLPVQSGSDKVLRDMNRNYKIKDFLKIVKKFRAVFPYLTLSTDVIVGYPTETAADFRKTLNLVEAVRPQVLNISKFWPREGTQASKLNPIDVGVVKKRASELMQLHNRISFDGNKKFIGAEVVCLVDKHGFAATWLSRSPSYRLVILKDKEKNLLGRFLKVKIAEARAHYLFGEIIQ